MGQEATPLLPQCGPVTSPSPRSCTETRPFSARRTRAREAPGCVHRAPCSQHLPACLLCKAVLSLRQNGASSPCTQSTAASPHLSISLLPGSRPICPGPDAHCPLCLPGAGLKGRAVNKGVGWPQGALDPAQPGHPLGCGAELPGPRYSGYGYFWLSEETLPRQMPRVRDGPHTDAQLGYQESH